jgi:beta-phosphoglucomutase-like phosphatase (HAD superfamily)
VTQALIFDCDGTLADTMPAHYQAWLEVLRPYGIAFPEDRFYAMGGMPTDKIVIELCGEAGRLLTWEPATGSQTLPRWCAAGGLPTRIDVNALVRDKALAFERKINEVRPIAKVVKVARASRGRLPMAVASGGQRRMVEKTLSQIGVLDWFPVVVTAEDTRRHKPEPDVFLEAARRLGVEPAACTVYEDTDLGLEAARRAGMRSVDVRRL